MTQHSFTTTESSRTTSSKTTQLEKNSGIRAFETKTKSLGRNRVKGSLTDHYDWADNEATEMHPDNNSSIEAHLAQSDTTQTKKLI